MNKHVASEHEAEKPFKCDICDHINTQKSVMNKHVASEHEAEKPFKFDICDHIYSQKSHSVPKLFMRLRKFQIPNISRKISDSLIV